MHSFQLPALRTHFSKTPNPPAVTAMVARDQFFDTAEEITVITAAIYVLSVEYDQLEKRPQDSEHLRRWIILRRQPVVESLLYRVEPPFTAWSEDQILKDVGAMMEELLSKTL